VQVLLAIPVAGGGGGLGLGRGSEQKEEVEGILDVCSGQRWPNLGWWQEDSGGDMRLGLLPRDPSRVPGDGESAWAACEAGTRVCAAKAKRVRNPNKVCGDQEKDFRAFQ
jgi:hypothetical protein